MFGGGADYQKVLKDKFKKDVEIFLKQLPKNNNLSEKSLIKQYFDAWKHDRNFTVDGTIARTTAIQTLLSHDLALLCSTGIINETQKNACISNISKVVEQKSSALHNLQNMNSIDLHANLLATTLKEMITDTSLMEVMYKSFTIDITQDIPSISRDIIQNITTSQAHSAKYDQIKQMSELVVELDTYVNNVMDSSLNQTYHKKLSEMLKPLPLSDTTELTKIKQSLKELKHLSEPNKKPKFGLHL